MRPLPGEQTGLPRLRHRADERLAHRHRDNRGRRKRTEVLAGNKSSHASGVAGHAEPQASNRMHMPGKARTLAPGRQDQPVITPAGVLVNAGARTAGTYPGFTWSSKKSAAL